MNTKEIDKILDRNSRTHPFYIGCFAADRIPRITRYPCCMVLNTDPSALEGSHWVAVFVPSPQLVEYFDSLADWPPVSNHIAGFLQRFPDIQRCPMALQSDRSGACGKHVIYFLWRRCQGWSLARICQHLQQCKSGADRLVCAFVRAQVFGDGAS